MSVQNLDKILLPVLQKGLAELNCHLSLGQQIQLIEFIKLLDQWNRVHNLTAISDPREMLHYHILDSLSVLPYLEGQYLLDVGTGAGLPGIPLAIARPDLKIVLLDSVQKKILFLQHVIHMLSLSHVTVVHQRVENYTGEKADTIISRAFSSLAEFVGKTDHLCKKDGVWVAMKGKVPQEELEILPNSYKMSTLQSVQVPGLTHRCLVFIHRNS